MPPARHIRDISPIEGNYRAMLDSVTVLHSGGNKRARDAGGSDLPDDEDLDLWLDQDQQLDVDGNDPLDGGPFVPGDAVACSEEDIEAIANPNLRSFIRTFGLARHLLGPLQSSVQSFEAATPSSELQLYENYVLPGDGADLHYAHLHQVMFLGLPLLAVQKSQDALNLMKGFASSVKERLNKLAATVDEIKAAQVLRVKDPEFFQQRPDEIGMDGEDLMSKPAGRKLVRGLIKDKLHSLRNVTKDRLAQSIGLFGQPAWNLLETAKQLYGNAGLEITPLRLYRLAFLRTAAASKQVYFEAQKKNSRGNISKKWVANPEFWAEVDKELKTLMRDLSSADAQTQKAANRTLKKMYLNDQAKYGKFVFDLGVRGERKEQEIDQYLAQASLSRDKDEAEKGKKKGPEANDSDEDTDGSVISSPAPSLPAQVRPTGRPYVSTSNAGLSTSLASEVGATPIGSLGACAATPELLPAASGINIPSRQPIDRAAASSAASTSTGARPALRDASNLVGSDSGVNNRSTSPVMATSRLEKQFPSGTESGGASHTEAPASGSFRAHPRRNSLSLLVDDPSKLAETVRNAAFARVSAASSSSRVASTSQASGRRSARSKGKKAVK
ncbi:hypothetical protein V8E36_001328 [Tilletia maclaganii]